MLSESLKRESLSVKIPLPSKMLRRIVLALLVIAFEGSAELKYLRRSKGPCDVPQEERAKMVKKYELHPESVSWFQAKARCEADEGILAAPTTCSDRADLRLLIANHSRKVSTNITNELHGGFFRPDYFVSVFGIPFYEVGYQRWIAGQENPQVCGTYNHNLLLYDAKCVDKRSFVCEFSTRRQVKQVNLTSAPLVAEPQRGRYIPVHNRIGQISNLWEPLMQQGRMHWYLFRHQTVRWWIAMNQCRELGGHLLVLNHQAEANAIKEFVRKQSNATDLMYVGFHNGNNLFISLIGEFMRDGWELEQPDDETCLAINREMLLQKVPCWQELNFICELTFQGQNDF